MQLRITIELQSGKNSGRYVADTYRQDYDEGKTVQGNSLQNVVQHRNSQHAFPYQNQVTIVNRRTVLENRR